MINSNDKKILKVLVEQEIRQIENEPVLISNSPYLNKFDEINDLDFLKSHEKYHQYLKDLLSKLD